MLGRNVPPSLHRWCHGNPVRLLRRWVQTAPISGRQGRCEACPTMVTQAEQGRQAIDSIALIQTQGASKAEIIA
jgi:hypothetical protein